MATSVGLEAHVIADDVRSGRRTPREVVAEHLAHIERHDPRLDAFTVVRADAALAEADELVARSDLGELPLAGVPVAIKDQVDVAGELTRNGSLAVTPAPATTDSIYVERLRAAGAVVVGKTRLPELAVWGATTNRMGATRNPWNIEFTTAGSSGGSAAAVASGMVPVALAADGLGSIRLPAAAAGIVGIKPGRDVVPIDPDASWYGMTQFGPLATSVTDAALVLGVLADDPGRWADPEPPEQPLRVAISVSTPLKPGWVAKRWKQAAWDAAATLTAAGHDIVRATPRYPASLPLSVVSRWSQGTLQDAERTGMALDDLEPRNRTLARLGQGWRRRRPVGPAPADAWHDTLDAFLADHDVLITPTMARQPLKVADWHERSFAANLAANSTRYPMTGPFNLADVPGVSVPMGFDEDGVPVAVQVIGRRGDEHRVLAVARELERGRPWSRIATGCVPPAD